MIVNILAFSTGLLGLITLLMLTSYNSLKTNRIANIYLVLIIFLVSTRYFINGILGIYQISYSIEIKDFINNLYLIIPPFFLLYFKNLVSNANKVKLSDFKHLITLIFFFIIDVIVRKSGYSSPILNNFYYLFFIIYTLYYLTSIYKVLHNNIWKRAGVIELTAKQNSLIKNWSKYLFISYLLISTRIVILILSEFVSSSFTYRLGQGFIWISSLIWISIFFKILIYPEILYGYDYLISIIKEIKTSENKINSFWNIKFNYEITNINDLKLEKIIKSSILDYINQIDLLNKTNEHFRNPNFTISDLAKISNIKKSHLIYLFKYHSNITFSEYKKIIRIQDSIKLIESNYLKKDTFDSLARKVGFISYNTFYHSFKDVTGVNPFVYNKNVKKNNI